LITESHITDMHLAVYYDIRTATFDKRKVVPPFATLQGLISDLESIREVGTFDLAFEVFDVSTEDPLLDSSHDAVTG
jgi:hypothetical protein